MDSPRSYKKKRLSRALSASEHYVIKFWGNKNIGKPENHEKPWVKEQKKRREDSSHEVVILFLFLSAFLMPSIRLLALFANNVEQ